MQRREMRLRPPSTLENIMSTVALCALLLAAVGDDDADRKQPRTIEEINDLNANKEQADAELKERAKQERVERMEQDDIDARNLERLNVDGWPAASRRAAADMVTRFGQPDEITDDKLIWKNAGDFKKIMVSRELTAHHFPAPHADVLTYVVDYKVPPSRFDDLAYFDGSVHADRTKGELSARCDSHEMNIAALNLADRIIRGQRTVAQARDILTTLQRRVQQGNAPPIAQHLQFNASRMATSDPDRPANRAMGR
jgi:hypothetical protein